MSNIIPWCKIWVLNSPTRYQRRNGLVRLDRPKPPTPQGGLILHWIISVIWIIASIGFGDISDALSIPGSIQIYGQAFIGSRSRGFCLQSISRLTLFSLVFVGIAYFLFLWYNDLPYPPQSWVSQTRSMPFWKKWLFWIMGPTYACVNVAITILPCIPPYQDQDGSNRKFKGWYFPALILPLALFSVVYYFSVFSSRYSILQCVGAKPEIQDIAYADGVDRSVYGDRQMLVVLTPTVSFQQL